MARIHYREIEGRSGGFYALLGVLGALILAGLGAAWYMEHNGHYVTGMSNRIVWGMPHVFAVFLIVAASGALNVASIASVFGRELYKPLARLSGLLALTLLAGGLAVLVLDLGRPERLIVAMTHYNFKSIFAWNIFLYTGFFADRGGLPVDDVRAAHERLQQAARACSRSSGAWSLPPAPDRSSASWWRASPTTARCSRRCSSSCRSPSAWRSSYWC